MLLSCPVARSKRVAVARHAEATPLILLGPADVVREAARRLHRVDLRGGIVLGRPRAATVHGDVGAAVVGLDHPLVVRGIDPQIVVVLVRNANPLPGPAPVAGPPEVLVVHVHGVAFLRVGRDSCVVERPRAQIAVRARLGPRGAGVARDEHASVTRLDVGVDPVGIRAGHRHADLSPEIARQARVAGQLRPCVPSVDRLEQAAAVAAAPQEPGLAVGLPERRVDDVGVGPRHREIDGTGPVASMEHVPPGPAAVARTEDAALVVRPEGVAEHGCVHEVAVRRVDAEPADHLLAGARRQPEMRPGAPTVGRAIDTVSRDDVAPELNLAETDVHHVRIRLADLDGADARRSELPISDRMPRRAGVVGLPETAPGGAEVVLIRPRTRPADGN